MIKHMRTTINMKDSLYRSIKEEAARRGTTITTVIEERLEYSVGKQPNSTPNDFELVTFDGDGLYPGIDLDSSSSLNDLLDGPNEPS